MTLSKNFKNLALFGLFMAPNLSLAGHNPTPGEVNAVKVVRYLYQLPEVRSHVVSLKPLAGELPDLEETLRLIDQARSEIIADLNKLADPRAAQALAASASHSLSLVTADLQDLEYDLLTHGKLTPNIKKSLQEVYDLYREIGG
jgi:hypothetical protein